MQSADLLPIAQQASTLAERLERARASRETPADSTLVQQRLNGWCEAVAKGSWETFHKRLAWDHLDLDTARRALSPPPRASGDELPHWANTLGEVLRLATPGTADLQVRTPRSGVRPTRSEHPGTAEPRRLGEAAPRGGPGGPRSQETEADRERRLLYPSQPFPFEEILALFVLVARRQLAAQAGDRYDLLSDEAHAAFERHLLQSLSRASAPTLQLEFSIVRSREESPLGRLFALAIDDDEDTIYRQFVDGMLGGRLLAFFREYAVLARILATMTDLWVEANAELLERLATDLTDLQASFGGEDDLGRVVAARAGLSDPHRGRRGVVVLTFGSGRQIVYKPKSLGIDAAYNSLSAWLNEHGAPLPLPILEVVDRSSYGWVSFVEHLPCDDREAARRYFRRAGMLLALVYLLEGTDCHLENVIASGEHPVLVDLETLLQHRVRDEDPDEGMQAHALASEQLGRSVLRTGLLPVWQLGPDGRGAYDVSGLGARDEQEMPTPAPTWVRVNTDRMTMEHKPARSRPSTNVPTVGGTPLRLDEHADDLVEGFRQMYRFVLDQRDALLATDSPLRSLADQHVRFIHRPTKSYGAILMKLFDPTYLRDGIDRGIQLELLARAMIRSDEKPPLWPVLAAEQQAMERIDVPFFTARAGDDGLEVVPGHTIAACFPEPSFDRVVAQLRALGEEDLEQQVQFIEGSLYAHRARDSSTLAPGSRGGAHADEDAPLDSERLVAEAVAIADVIRARAIRAADGSATWIAPQFLPQAERYQLRAVSYDLYGGSSGIALFLAAVHRATGDDEYRDLALAALKALRRELHTRSDRIAGQVGVIGGAVGLGSLVYGLVGVSRLLDEPALLEDAHRAVSLITLDLIAADSRLDVIAGAAGSILSLLSLYGVSNDRGTLDRAIACGQRLLETRTPSQDGFRTWPTYEGRLLTGFSHGAAGIAYALLRLYEVTRERSLLAAAEEAIAYEASVFSPDDDNWPDLRNEGQRGFAGQWCHGAPGIGLARLGGLAVLDDVHIRRDVESALRTTRRVGIQNLDHLCCGNLGRAELLLAAADRLSRPDLVTQARRWAAAVVIRAEREGGFALHPLLPRVVYNPGLYQGTAGIGYELLRLAQPGLPSVLLWE